MQTDLNYFRRLIVNSQTFYEKQKFLLTRIFIQILIFGSVRKSRNVLLSQMLHFHREGPYNQAHVLRKAIFFKLQR